MHSLVRFLSVDTERPNVSNAHVEYQSSNMWPKHHNIAVDRDTTMGWKLQLCLDLIVNTKLCQSQAPCGAHRQDCQALPNSAPWSEVWSKQLRDACNPGHNEQRPLRSNASKTLKGNQCDPKWEPKSPIGPPCAHKHSLPIIVFSTETRDTNSSAPDPDVPDHAHNARKPADSRPTLSPCRAV